ncbi:hypothetical protein [Gimesia aquarii]|uniref:Uncharacterized protein n=1 Tax=Gimesia aquarii TaxID=2527964 RepID=A0A517VTW8_9PLAN|nr:hypothetical protein [Gimesia aquarii]QDT96419.1 hypothetical protein V144x_18740 [Gimesia aquarii]
MINQMIWMRLLHTLSITAMTGIWFLWLSSLALSDPMTRSSHIEEYSILISTTLFGGIGLFIGFIVGLVTWDQVVIKYQLDERTVALSYVVFTLVGLLVCSILKSVIY